MSLLKTEPALPIRAQEAPTVLADMVAAFFRVKRKIVAALLTFLLLVTAIIVLGQKTYESRMVFLVRDEGSTLPTASLDAHSDTQINSATDTQIGTEIELLSGDELHRQVISAMHPEMSSRAVEHQLLSFDKNLQVSPLPKSTLISVSYTASSREVANATLAALSRLYLEYRAKIRGSDGAYEFFDQQTRHYYQELQDDQAQLADFDQKYQVTLLGEEKDVIVHKLADARALLYENEASTREAKNRIQAMTSARGTLPPRITTQRRDLPNQVEAERLNSVLVDLQNKRVELLTKYHPTDRHVEEVDGQIANTREALTRAEVSKSTEVQSDLNPLRQSVDSDLQQSIFRAVGLEARQQSLSAQVNAYDAKLQQLNQVTAGYDDLTRKVKEDEASYELYTNKREGARIDRTLDNDKIANVRQVSEPAIVPQSRTQALFGVVCIYIIGTVLIAGMGILAGLWSPYFHSPRELEAAIDSPVLATIPLLVKDARRKGRVGSIITARSSTREASDAEASDSLGEGVFLQGLAERRPGWPAGSMSRYIAGVHSDGSRPAGVYLSLIEKLRGRATSQPGAGSVFTFTACNRGEGVSHFVRGLGAELTSYTGKRVAIVNALDSYESAVERTSVLPAELRSRAAASGEDFLKQWLQRLRETHDYVLIDCPALSTSHAAAVFGPKSDGLLLVVAAGRATRIQLRGGLAMLSLASVSVLGLVLNKRRYPVPAAIYNLL